MKPHKEVIPNLGQYLMRKFDKLSNVKLESSQKEYTMTTLFHKIAFTHYGTKNLQRAVEFYRDVLGLKLLLKNEEWAEFDIGGQRFALHQVNSSETFQPITEPGAAAAFYVRP